MPHRVPLRAGDPRRVGRYALNSRLDGIPSDDPIFTGNGPDGAQVCVSVLGGYWDGAASDRFAAEAAVAKRVPPFCAARVLDAGLDGNAAYLVSEYVPGQSLLELVAEQGVFDGQQLEALAIGMATGLASVHQAGLVHGSFGPQHVVLPVGGPPCVVEFGITPPYGTATPSADMLAWARTVVFAATGQPPAESADLGVLPETLRQPVLQCLTYESSERPAARAVVQFLLGGGLLHAGVLADGSRRAEQASWSTVEAEQALGPEQDGSSYGDRAAAPPRPAAPRQRGDAGNRAVRHAPQPSPSSRARTNADGRGRGRVPAAGTAADPYRQTQRRAATARPASRRRTAWVVGGASAVVIVVVVVLTMILLQSGNNGRTAASADTPPAHGSRPAATSPPVTSTAKAPAAFDGTWKGLVTSPGISYQMTVQFKTGQDTGTISYTSAAASCTGGVTLTTATTSQMTMTMDARGCSKGAVVTVTQAGPGKINFNLQGSPSASGTLSHQ
jgi:hypothetical protein